MSHRRGVTVTEVVCGAILTGIVLSTLVPGMYWIRRQNKAAVQHQDAISAVSNILDEVTTWSFDDVTPERLNAIETPSWISGQLIEPKLTMTSVTTADGKRVTAELSWLATNGAGREKVRLHAWVFGGGPTE